MSRTTVFRDGSTEVADHDADEEPILYNDVSANAYEVLFKEGIFTLKGV
jgi:hypothetical protein